MRSSNELDLDGLKRSSLSRQFLQNVRKKFTTGYTEVLWGKTSVDIPCKKLAPLSKEFCAAHSGPEGGIGHTNVSSSDLEKKATEDIDLINWKKWHHRAYGMAMSLYERTLDGEHLSGDPVADVFAVVARSNNCILILADGVNWGEKARLAAKSAVRGCMEYLNKNLFDSLTTHDVMEHLVRSFQYAQKCITDSEATMTTLCAGVVCELQGTNKWGLCTLNVGDSLAFVYSKRSGLREVTIGSHLDVRRDVTNPGGSLGRVDGYNPDLANLTCSFTTLEPGDIVFLTSDGITDNFDPVICKSYPKDITSFNQILEDKNSKKNTKEKKYSDSDSEIREFEQRHTGMINEMKEVITTESCPCDGNEFSAKELCGKFLTKVTLYTEKKRLAHEAYSKYTEELKHKKSVETVPSHNSLDLPVKVFDTQNYQSTSSSFTTKDSSDNCDLIQNESKLLFVEGPHSFGQVPSCITGRTVTEASKLSDHHLDEFGDNLYLNKNKNSHKKEQSYLPLSDKVMVQSDRNLDERLISYNSSTSYTEDSAVGLPHRSQNDCLPYVQQLSANVQSQLAQADHEPLLNYSKREPRSSFLQPSELDSPLTEKRRNKSPNNVSQVQSVLANESRKGGCSAAENLLKTENCRSIDLKRDSSKSETSGGQYNYLQAILDMASSKTEAKLIKDIHNASGKLDHASIVSFEVGYFEANISNEYDIVNFTDSIKLCNNRDETKNVLESLFL